jgi:phytoene desaturase
MSPFRCPSLFSILSFLEYEHGVHHPIGGCGAVTTAMARVAREMGVEIRLGEPVREVLFQGRRAHGVRTDAGEIACDALLINADFARAMTRLVPDRLRRRWTDRKLERKKFSCSTFMLYLGIDGLYDQVPHHTIYISQDYVQNLDEIENRHVLSDDPSFYVQNASVTDPTLAPAGRSTLYVLVPVTHQHPNVDWRQERARYRDLALSKLPQIAASAPSGWLRRSTGTRGWRSTAAPRSTSPTTSARCSTCGRTTASRTSTASIWWAAARTRAAACR